MFISWKSFSWLTMMGVVFFWFFFTLESPLIFWFFLEVGVWGTFFFFLVGEEEEKSKTSMSFFIIQGLSSLFWITLLSLKNGLSEMIIPLIIFMKMGLIPGHFWAWKIYESGNPYLILIISFFQKILPLGMIFFCLSGGDLTCSSLKILIVLNMISSCYFLKKEMNLNLFLLISSMVHFNNMIFLLMSEKVLETVFYFFSYSLLLFFALLFSLSYHKSLISLDSGGPSSGESAWMLGALSIAGFPPSLMFFIKIIMLVNLGNVIQSFFFLFFAVLLFFYLLIMVSSFVQFVHLSSTLYGGVGFSLEESKKNFANPSIFFLFSFSFIIFLLVSFSLLVLEKKKILLTPLGLSYY